MVLFHGSNAHIRVWMRNTLPPDYQMYGAAVMTDLFPLAMFTWGLLIGAALTNLYLKCKYTLTVTP